MNQDYITPNVWSIIEEGFDPESVKSSESLFSLGNGAMGQRANFEETYTGETFQGSYIAGVYYPDKTRVGWWKNGYPEYFAKVLNAPNWIGINVTIDGETLDLNTCKSVKNFVRELNMQAGYHKRSFIATLENDVEVEVAATRFLSLKYDELGVINYEVKVLNRDAEIQFTPYLCAGITNQDSNWDDKFWDVQEIKHQNQQGFIKSMTNKTHFYVGTFMQSFILKNGEEQTLDPEVLETETSLNFSYTLQLKKGDTATIQKYGGYVTSMNHTKENLQKASQVTLQNGIALGYEALLQQQKNDWARIWDMADITIDGDVKAQQGIRFNIFQLNQTYLGKDERLNIGPKGFTGEKYGGSTYWDTEAYCIPFYMATKDETVARNLLVYRYNHLEKAIENAQKLGFTNGAALYPMVTMNGEESHNEWEITFEEIHRNGAMVFAIFNYVRYTGDFDYVVEMGLEVMIAIARFWYQRFNFSSAKQQYVMLGVTGPNEYENNVNNNWYTNYLAKWCIDYTIECLEKIRGSQHDEFNRIKGHCKLEDSEIMKWQELTNNVYFPKSEEHDVFLQQDGFLDKEITPVSQLHREDRPINQKWSWDRILRSCYIKQADVLQGFYFFEDHFSTKELQRHFDFYEPLTVHESSLSPCVHSIQAAKLGKMDQAYEFYLRTSRLDLDDYNKEVEEGCHITSMAGTWMSIVEGFGGMRIVGDMLAFKPRIPKQWNGYSFKVNFRNQIVKVSVTQAGNTFTVEGGDDLTIMVNDKEETISATALVKSV